MQRWSAPILALGTLCIIVAVFALLGGCKSDSSRARETASAFLNAVQRHDVPAAEAQMTRAARERGWAGQNVVKENNSLERGYTLGDPRIEKDAAQVPVTFTTDDKESAQSNLRLRREDGAWKVWGLTFRKEDMEFTVDFENPENMVGDVGRLFGQALGATLREAAKGMESFFKGLNQGAEQMNKEMERSRQELEKSQEETRRELEKTRQELERAREELQRATGR